MYKAREELTGEFFTSHLLRAVTRYTSNHCVLLANGTISDALAPVLGLGSINLVLLNCVFVAVGLLPIDRTGHVTDHLDDGTLD